MHRPDQDARLNDERFMREALALARGNTARTSPNPSVGAVLVREGVILSRGVTQPPGGNHAEIEALRACEDPRAATLYLTLEPCYGARKRTPPCVDAIVRAGVARVVIGMRDPNPSIDGRGIAVLREAGIEVEEGVLEEEARRCHEAFAKWIVSGVPLVTLKLALTLDGRLTWGDGRRKAVTGQRAQELVHALRARSDAVLTGIGTVLADDPQLTVRLADGKSPLRAIVDSRLRIPSDAQVLRGHGGAVVFCTQDADARKREVLARLCEVVQVPAREGRVDLAAVLAELGKRDVTSVLVEAGPELARAMLDAGLVDKVVMLVAPFAIGEGKAALEGLSKGFSLERVRVEQVGADAVVEGYVRKE